MADQDHVTLTRAQVEELRRIIHDADSPLGNRLQDVSSRLYFALDGAGWKPNAALAAPAAGAQQAAEMTWAQAQLIKQRDYAAHDAWWTEIKGDEFFDLTTRNQSAAAYAKGREQERAEALAASAAAQEAPALSCRHSNRSDCGLFELHRAADLGAEDRKS